MYSLEGKTVGSVVGDVGSIFIIFLITGPSCPVFEELYNENGQKGEKGHFCSSKCLLPYPEV